MARSRWILLTLLIAPWTAAAQPGIQAQGIIGYANFLDEVYQSHFAVGGSARFPVWRGLGVEPEFLFLYRDRPDHDYVVTGNASYQFRRNRPVRPYIIGGAGWIVTSIRTPVTRFQTTSGTVSLGGGVRVFLNDRWFVSPEVRLGSEPFFRLTAGIGYSFGGR